MRRIAKSGVVALAAALTITALPALAQSVAPKGEKRIVIREASSPEVIVLGDGELGFGAYLGVHLVNLTPELREHFRAPRDAGVMVSRIGDDSPAGRAGLRVGDVITAIDGQKVSSATDVRRAVARKRSGEKVRIDYSRGGGSLQAQATVAERRHPAAALGESFEVLAPRALEASAEVVQKLQTYFDSPEWKQRMERMRDCNTRVEELEQRLRELEKRLAK
jgi:serine protease Do